LRNSLAKIFDSEFKNKLAQERMSDVQVFWGKSTRKSFLCTFRGVC